MNAFISTNRREATIALAVYATLVGVCWLAGERMVIPYEFGHLLPRELLEDRLGESLLYLHSQPPILNLLLGLTLKIARWSGVAPETVGFILQFMLGGLVVSAWAALVGRLVAPGRRRWICLGLLVLHPVLYSSLFLYFYMLHETLLLAAVVVFAHRYMRRRRIGDFAVVSFLLVAMCYLRSMFHPLWAVAMLLWMKAPLGWGRSSAARRGRRREWAIFAGAILLLLAWPAKNALIFGRFTYSTWTGFNLAQGLPIDASEFGAGMFEEAPAQFADIPAVAERLQHIGSRNMNHYGAIGECEALGREAKKFLKERPFFIFVKAARNYWRFTRYSGRQPYTGYYGSFFECSPWMRSWHGGYERILFLDFRSRATLDSVDIRIHPESLYEDYPQEWTLAPFCFTFPLIIIGAAVAIRRRRRRRPLQTRAAAYMLFCILWVLAMTLFIDGAEGNRLRFSTEPFLFVLVFWLISPPKRAAHAGNDRLSHALNPEGMTQL